MKVVGPKSGLIALLAILVIGISTAVVRNISEITISTGDIIFMAVVGLVCLVTYFFSG